MNEIIKVNYDEDKPTISARELYDALSGDGGTKGTERFSKWFERYCGYGFIEGEDYFNPYPKVRVQNEDNREVQREVDDYDLSIDMAKQICMLQKTERGKQLRTYLIRVEEAWNTPEQVMARALEFARQKIEEVKSQHIILIEKNEILSAENDLLSQKNLEWADRAVILALVRAYAHGIGDEFQKAWRDFKKELLYRHGININSRITNYLNKTGKRTKPKTLDMLDDSELPAALSTITAMCRENSVDISEIIQKKAG